MWLRCKLSGKSLSGSPSYYKTLLQNIDREPKNRGKELTNNRYNTSARFNMHKIILLTDHLQGMADYQRIFIDVHPQSLTLNGLASRVHYPFYYTSFKKSVNRPGTYQIQIHAACSQVPTLYNIQLVHPKPLLTCDDLQKD